MAKFGIIGAMESEVVYLKGQIADAQITQIAGMEFVEGTLGGASVVVVQSGYGKVAAGICAQALASVFAVTHVVFTGVAGSLDARLDIGDIVVSHDCVQHDFDLQALGFAAGEIPGLGVGLVADAGLVAHTLSAAQAVAPDVAAVEGCIATGDQFVSSDNVKQHLVDDYGAICCEMEGGAVAQACVLNAIPFVIIRVISDKADGSATVDFPTFEKAAADRCAHIVKHLVSSFAG